MLVGEQVTATDVMVGGVMRSVMLAEASDAQVLVAVTTTFGLAGTTRGAV
jgi:hypothetical protein